LVRRQGAPRFIAVRDVDLATAACGPTLSLAGHPGMIGA
jgi:hypothetical protein